jgi:hypothetical protein
MNTIVQDVANIQQILSEILCTLGSTVEPRDGLSAYQLAVQNGDFTGTLDEYLESLHGEKGDPGDPGVFILNYNDIFNI